MNNIDTIIQTNILITIQNIIKNDYGSIDDYNRITWGEPLLNIKLALQAPINLSYDNILWNHREDNIYPNHAKRNQFILFRA